MPQTLECRPLCPALLAATCRFFERIVAAGLDRYFHPHPFTPDEAERRVHYHGQDVYLALLWDGEIIGYGMLRGWDEGYAIPSLGIVIDPAMQGRGHGRLLMNFLHAVAAMRGAEQVRLTVYPENTQAITLYQSLGYTFAEHTDGQLVGFKNLTHRSVSGTN